MLRYRVLLFIEFRVPSFEFRVSSFEFRISCFEFRVSSFEFRVSSFWLAGNAQSFHNSTKMKAQVIPKVCM